jgi:hypothetical protein
MLAVLCGEGAAVKVIKADQPNGMLAAAAARSNNE